MGNTSAKTLALYAAFIALTLLLGLTPLGLIPLGIINVTILAVPVIIGAILLGLKAGLVFGACFGLVSFLSALGMSLVPPSGLAQLLLGKSPLLLLLACFVPRLLIPLTTHFAYVAASKRMSPRAATVPAAIVGSLTNTIFYLGLLLLFFTITGLDNTRLLTIIGGTGIVAGSLEALAAALLSTPIVLALQKLHH